MIDYILKKSLSYVNFNSQSFLIVSRKNLLILNHASLIVFNFLGFHTFKDQVNEKSSHFLELSIIQMGQCYMWYNFVFSSWVQASFNPVGILYWQVTPFLDFILFFIYPKSILESNYKFLLSFTQYFLNSHSNTFTKNFLYFMLVYQNDPILF